MSNESSTYSCTTSIQEELRKEETVNTASSVSENLPESDNDASSSSLSINTKSTNEKQNNDLKEFRSSRSTASSTSESLTQKPSSSCDKKRSSKSDISKQFSQTPNTTSNQTSEASTRKEEHSLSVTNTVLTSGLPAENSEGNSVEISSPSCCSTLTLKNDRTSNSNLQEEERSEISRSSETTTKCNKILQQSPIISTTENNATDVNSEQEGPQRKRPGGILAKNERSRSCSVSALRRRKPRKSSNTKNKVTTADPFFQNQKDNEVNFSDLPLYQEAHLRLLGGNFCKLLNHCPISNFSITQQNLSTVFDNDGAIRLQ